MDPNALEIGALLEPESPDIQQSSPKEIRVNTSPRVLNMEVRGSITMELIVDKLRLLDYERQFCNSKSPPWPRLHKFFFALPSTNSNDEDQFFHFSSIVAWLFTRLGCHFPPLSKADDPNLTCDKITTELISLGFAAPNWPPAQLNQGHGDEVCAVLDTLCNLVLDAIKYQFKSITNFPTENAIPTNPSPTDHAELYIIKDQINTMPHLSSPYESSNDQTLAPNSSAPTANQWKLEVERIAPQLRIEVIADGNNWRGHLEQARKLYEETVTQAGPAMAQLQRFKVGVATSMDMLQSHENFLNQDLEGLILEYVAVKGRLVDVEEKCSGIREANRKLSCEHCKVLVALEQVKQKMVEKGNEISDLTPLLQMRAAMQRLRLELQEMEVQIGVLEHSLMQVSIQQARGDNTDSDAKG